MRVLYLNPFSQQVSGPDESLMTLLDGLIPLGVEPTVLLPRYGPQVARYRQRGIHVEFTPMSLLKRRIGPRHMLSYVPSLLVGASSIAKIARSRRVEIIHTNMEVVLDGAAAAAMAGIPHVLHYRGNTLDEPKFVFDVLTRVWTGVSDKVFCISRGTADIFFRRGLGSGVEVLYNPVDCSRYSAATRSDALRAELGAGPSDLLIGAVGRIHPRKDLVTFVRACAELATVCERVRFVVVGGAEAPEEVVYERELRSLVDKLGIASQFVFCGPRTDVPNVMKALDVMVLSSRHEGFGRVVVEAMAAGVPVVATNEGALPELVADGETGFLFPATDHHRLSQCVLELLNTAEIRAQFGTRARARALAFDAPQVARRVFDTYLQVLGRAEK